MGLFNARRVNGVNAQTANDAAHSRIMGKKAETEPSEFWKRLAEAWRAKGLPTSQNGVAKKLKMSQGSTRRWFTGEGLPETDTIIDIAERGDVTVDWLLTGRLPKKPVTRGSELERLLFIWEDLHPDGRSHVLQDAEGQMARRQQSKTPSIPSPLMPEPKTTGVKRQHVSSRNTPY